MPEISRPDRAGSRRGMAPSRAGAIFLRNAKLCKAIWRPCVPAGGRLTGFGRPS